MTRRAGGIKKDTIKKRAEERAKYKNKKKHKRESSKSEDSYTTQNIKKTNVIRKNRAPIKQ